jgi:hypothetical protein
MTTTTKARSTGERAADTRRRYEDDLYGWVEEQVALLKAGRLSEIDAVNIAEELGDVGKDQYDKLESAIRIVVLHLLKWDYQPARRSRSWVLSIQEHRRRIARLLKKNPSLKSSLDDAVDEGYEDARGDAIRETDLPAESFPHVCPYVWDVIVDRVVALGDVESRGAN